MFLKIWEPVVQSKNHFYIFRYLSQQLTIFWNQGLYILVSYCCNSNSSEIQLLKTARIYCLTVLEGRTWVSLDWNQGVDRTAFLSGGCRRDFIFWPWTSFERLPAFLGLWPPPIFKASNGWSSFLLIPSLWF